MQIEPSGTALVNASGEQVDLSLFSPFLLTARPMAGTLAFRADGIVGPDTLSADARVDLVDGRWGDHALEEIRGGVSLRDDRAHFDDMVFRSSLAQADLSRRRSAPRSDAEGSSPSTTVTVLPFRRFSRRTRC